MGVLMSAAPAHGIKVLERSAAAEHAGCRLGASSCLQDSALVSGTRTEGWKWDARRSSLQCIARLSPVP